MAIKFWYVDGACSLSVRICLNETETAFESIRTVIGEGGTFSEEFGKINPKRAVPVISIDGNIITELPAIFTAISLLSPDKQIMGSSNLETAQVYEWLAWLTGTLHTSGFGAFWRPGRFSEDVSAQATVKAKVRKTIEECYKIIEPRLSSEYAVGRKFTSVDALLLVYYTWGNMIGFDMRQYFNYSKYIAKLLTRQAVVDALEVENVTIDGPKNLPDLS